MAGANSGSGYFSPDIVTVSKDFKYPQVFRANLALEQRLPGDIKMTLEGIYSKTMNNVFFENLALTNNGEKYMQSLEWRHQSLHIILKDKAIIIASST